MRALCRACSCALLLLCALGGRAALLCALGGRALQVYTLSGAATGIKVNPMQTVGDLLQSVVHTCVSERTGV